jgi:N-succinyldiaminopimelate aminotransferase
MNATVIVPNPFYQIYEGAAVLARAQTHCVNVLRENGYAPRWEHVPEAVWNRVQLLYVCSPDNPTGRVMTLDDWRLLFALSDRHGFVIAADECYSEVYFDEARPPLGSLGAAKMLGRDGYPRLVSFGSLSKRSNAPGLRSGYVAGDAALIQAFLHYRTYHGSAMSPAVAAASLAAWRDEAHVRANRAAYARKFSELTPRVAASYDVTAPDAAFYLWVGVGRDDAAFARELYADQAVTVLPGSYLGRVADGVNPGHGFVRVAFVAEFDECAEAVDRMIRFAQRR